LLRPDWRWENGPEQLDSVDLPAATILLPVSFRAVAWTVRHRDALARRWSLPALPSVDALRTTHDKATLIAFAAAHGLPVPASAAPNLSAASGLSGEVPYPVVLKSRRGAGGDGTARYDTPAALRARLIAEPDPDAYQVQQWLGGEDANCGLLCRDGRVLAAVAFVGLTREAPFMPFRSIELVDDPAALEVATQLVAALAWSGLANVDMRRDADGRLYVLELNPRAGSSLRAAIAAGLNFPDLWCRTALGAVPPQPVPIGRRYFTTLDLIMLLRDRLRGRSTAPLPGWRESGLRFVCRDPWLHLRAWLDTHGAGGWRALGRQLAGDPTPEARSATTRADRDAANPPRPEAPRPER
jgi:glutathione synthase/RimK-type ligase-like ATP-grasp enzyme